MEIRYYAFQRSCGAHYFGTRAVVHGFSPVILCMKIQNTRRWRYHFLSLIPRVIHFKLPRIVGTGTQIPFLPPSPMIDKHRSKMEQPAPPPQCGTPSSLSDDLSLHIASLLEASDVCSLGSCSRAWRALCASDCIWIALARDRWPTLAAGGTELGGGGSELSPVQGWRDFYISKHREVASCVSSVVNFVDQCSQNGLLEVGNYLKAIGVLTSMNLSFKDVQMFLLAREHGVLLNLIGLHYSLLVLRIPPCRVMEALQSSQVSEKQVGVSWFTVGRWFYGFRLPNKHVSRKVSLGELSADKQEVLSELNQGAVHGNIRVHISAVAVTAAQGP